MSSLQEQLHQLEAELTRQDRDIAAALSVLREYGTPETEIQMSRELWTDFEDAWSATQPLCSPSTPIVGARC